MRSVQTHVVEETRKAEIWRKAEESEKENLDLDSWLGTAPETTRRLEIGGGHEQTQQVIRTEPFTSGREGSPGLRAQLGRIGIRIEAKGEHGAQRVA